MTYTHLTPDELVLIEAYFYLEKSVVYVAKKLGCSRQTIYNVYHFLEEGHSALTFYQRYKENKTHCGRRSITLPVEQQDYIRNMVTQGWTPDLIVGRAACTISCSVRTLYRLFKTNFFD